MGKQWELPHRLADWLIKGLCWWRRWYFDTVYKNKPPSCMWPLTQEWKPDGISVLMLPEVKMLFQRCEPYTPLYLDSVVLFLNTELQHSSWGISFFFPHKNDHVKGSLLGFCFFLDNFKWCSPASDHTLEKVTVWCSFKGLTRVPQVLLILVLSSHDCLLLLFPFLLGIISAEMLWSNVAVCKST